MYGATNQLTLTPADGGMSVRQTKLPLTFATNDLTRMTISPDGRVLINTGDLTPVTLCWWCHPGKYCYCLGIDNGVTAVGTNTNLATGNLVH